ncbi:UDP-N-acetylmuramate--L-alanine ligase, partial [bacterium]|nr:UDP-N-acetylmuramate--L-alanine ligase [bacterium]
RGILQMNFLETKKIHFIGMGGIGVSALAKLFAARGADVSGSDISDFPDRKALEDRGMKIVIGHGADNIPLETQAVVFSSAVPMDNLEFVEAENRGILTLQYIDALAEIMKDQSRYGIAVSGTNGKTTTTALLGKMLEKNGFDPLVIVGGKVPGWDGPGRAGNLRLPTTPRMEEMPQKFPYNIFLVEACEYERHMLRLSPNMIVLTNIEADHLDYYKDLGDVKAAFKEYAQKLPEDGALIYNGDDPACVELAENAAQNIRKVSYAIEREADVRAVDISQNGERQHFRILSEGTGIGMFETALPGRFNISNILAASTAFLTLGGQAAVLRSTLAEFGGAWRRFEKVGTFRGKVVISDYAHHPSAVRETLRAAKDLYRGKKILTVFQPHQKDRTRKFMKDFVLALCKADSVILSEIYDVAGRDGEGETVSSEDLMREMR